MTYDHEHMAALGRLLRQDNPDQLPLTKRRRRTNQPPPANSDRVNQAEEFWNE